MRSREHPWGLPGLPAEAQQRADLGSLLVRRSLQLAAACSRLGVGWLWEHPEDLGSAQRGVPASVWALPEMRQLATYIAVRNRCDFGCEEPRKPTRWAGNVEQLLCLGTPGWPVLDSQVRYLGPLQPCGHRHSQLLGAAAPGTFRTAPTAAYPPQLCQVVAQVIAEYLEQTPMQDTAAARGFSEDLHEDVASQLPSAPQATAGDVTESTTSPPPAPPSTPWSELPAADRWAPGAAAAESGSELELGAAGDEAVVSDEPSSDQDEDGHTKAKRGEGRVG